MTEGNTWLNALIGAGVAIVFSFIPFSTLLGGAVAGYLQKGDYGAGAKVGALAGLIALLPLAMILLLIFGLVAVVPGPGVPERTLMLFVLTFGLFVLVVYTVGFAALGGVIGSYLHREVEPELADEL